MDRSIEQHYMAELNVGNQPLRREINYNPAYFNRMVAELGPAEASRQLIQSRSVSDGFTTLWEHGMLDLAVEALALLPWYDSLFTDTVRELAPRRLVDYHFDVDSFVARRMESPPDWYSFL